MWSDLFLGTTLNTSNWVNGITSRAADGWLWNEKIIQVDGQPISLSAVSQPGGTSAEFFDPRRVVVDNGLTISAVPSTEYPGFTYASGCICSYNKVSIKTGIVRVHARMPDTTHGAWPAIWFLPGPTGTHGDNGEIDVQEGGLTGRVAASVSPNETVASTFHRPDLGGYQLGFGFDANVDLSAGYHNYDLELSVGMVRALFDDEPVATWTKNLLGDEMQIIIGLSVATTAARGWHTTGTPVQPCRLQVNGVGVWV